MSVRDRRHGMKAVQALLVISLQHGYVWLSLITKDKFKCGFMYFYICNIYKSVIIKLYINML